MESPEVAQWDHGETEPVPYGNTATYRLGAEWLADCSLIADWGCGKGFLRTLIEPDRYRGIDGSPSPFADEIADLTEYRSETPGVFLRHVLEHNYRWAAILDNAIASFTERMVLILFTPLASRTHEIDFVPPGVPDISFCLDDLTGPIDRAGATWSAEAIDTETHYGTETIIRVQR